MITVRAVGVRWFLAILDSGTHRPLKLTSPLAGRGGKKINSNLPDRRAVVKVPSR